jgi:hypothetical protein
MMKMTVDIEFDFEDGKVYPRIKSSDFKCDDPDIILQHSGSSYMRILRKGHHVDYPEGYQIGTIGGGTLFCVSLNCLGADQ